MGDQHQQGERPGRKGAGHGRDDGGGGPAKASVRAKAAELERSAGIPRPLAYQVALGNMKLNDVLERMMTRDRVEALIKRHDLARSLATQVALGQADLQLILRRRALTEHRERYGTHSILEEARTSGQPVSLGLLGNQLVSGKILELDRYELRFQPQKGEEVTIHKLQVKYGMLTERGHLLRGAVKAPSRRVDATPILRPQDRYGISDDRLFGYREEAAKVLVRTVEDETIRGMVSWMGKWEFGVHQRNGSEIVVMRHAVADMREG